MNNLEKWNEDKRIDDLTITSFFDVIPASVYIALDPQRAQGILNDLVAAEKSSALTVQMNEFYYRQNPHLSIAEYMAKDQTNIRLENIRTNIAVLTGILHSQQ